LEHQPEPEGPKPPERETEVVRVRERRGERGIDMATLEAKTLSELRDLAKAWEISGFSRLKKEDLILRLLRAKADREGLIFGGGVLDIVDDNKGYLRRDHYKPGPDDVYVSSVADPALRVAHRRPGRRSGAPAQGEREVLGLLRVEAVNGMDPERRNNAPVFETPDADLPQPTQLILETNPDILATRLLSLIAPIGKGQRGLIVSPPKAGKTTVLKRIANGISTNHPRST
jgi:transcription termination factor Rho